MSQQDLRRTIISGFIREIHKNNANHAIAPSIMDLCYRYFINSFKIFASNRHQFYTVNIYKNGITNIFVPNESSTETITENTYQLSSVWCYTPNITSNHHGFIGSISKGDIYPNKSPQNPCIVLFDSTNSNNFMNDYELIISDEIICTEQQQLKNYPIFCGNKHGIIFEDNGNLYQFKPSISTENIYKRRFNYTKLYTSTNIQNDDKSNTWLSLCYQHKTETIFAITNTVEALGPITSLNIPMLQMNEHGVLTKQKRKLKTSKQTMCNMFDLNNKTWKAIDSYEYQSDFDDTFRRFGICENQYSYDIYIQSNCGHTAKYDLHKQKWITMIQDIYNENMRFGGVPLLWFDTYPFVLYCACDPYFGYLDIRLHHKEWCKISNINHSISSLFL